MIVVVDTNIFHGDPRMQRRNFRVLVGQHGRGRFALVIPEVVVREVIKLCHREYADTHRKFESSTRKLRELGHDPDPQPVPDADTARDAFAAWFRQQLSDSAVTIAPMPAADMSGLVDLAVAERRPLRSESKGFRDVVIWRTILELAGQDEVVFITKNWRGLVTTIDAPASWSSSSIRSGA